MSRQARRQEIAKIEANIHLVGVEILVLQSQSDGHLGVLMRPEANAEDWGKEDTRLMKARFDAYNRQTQLYAELRRKKTFKYIWFAKQDTLPE